MPRNAIESVDAYLAAQPEASQRLLRRVRQTLRKAIPGSEESISYGIPTYKLPGGPVLYFAGWKSHYSVYPASPAIIATLAKALAPYEVAKGTIRFPLDEAVPVALLTRLAKLRIAELAARAKTKKPAAPTKTKKPATKTKKPATKKARQRR